MTGIYKDNRTFVYRIDAENRIISLNQEWLDFARENQAPELTPENTLGQPLDRFIAGWEPKHLYELIYDKVRRAGHEVRFPFNCDSPGVRRFFQMRLAPLENGILEFTIEVMRIEPVPLRPILDNSVEHSPEFVVICSWCKKIRLEDGSWVEIWAANKKKNLFGASPPSLTHEVCPDCLAALRRQLEGS